MQPRSRNWTLVLGAFVVAWFFQPLWNRNLEYAAEQRGWEKALHTVLSGVPDWVGGTFGWLNSQGFWGGAFSVLAVWGCLEVVYAVQRKRRAAATPQTAGVLPGGPPLLGPGVPLDVVEDAGRVSFDYSASNGRIQIGNVERLFVLRFTKAGDRAIHLTKHGTNLVWIARVKDAPPGSSVDPEGLERSSDNYTIGLGELFMAQNPAGYVVQGRVEHIADDARGAERDELAFAYRIMLPRNAGAASSHLKVLV